MRMNAKEPRTPREEKKWSSATEDTEDTEKALNWRNVERAWVVWWGITGMHACDARQGLYSCAAPRRRRRGTERLRFFWVRVGTFLSPGRSSGAGNRSEVVCAECGFHTLIMPRSAAARIGYGVVFRSPSFTTSPITRKNAASTGESSPLRDTALSSDRGAGGAIVL